MMSAPTTRDVAAAPVAPVAPASPAASAAAAPVVAAAGVSILLVVTLSHLVNDALTEMLAPLLPSIREAYGASIAQTAVLVSILSLTGSMIQPLVGVVGDRVDRRLLAALGPILTAVGMTLIGFAPNFAVLGLLIALGGLGSAIFHPSGAAYATLGARADRRGLFAALFSAGGTAGLALGPLIATHLRLKALPSLIPAAVVVAGIAYAATPSTRVEGTARRRWRDYAALWRGPIRTLWTTGVLRSIAVVTFADLLAFQLHGRGAPQATIGYALAAFNIASALGGIAGGRVSDRAGRVVVLRWTLAASLPLLLAAVFSTPAQWWYYPLLVLAGAASNAGLPVAVVAAQEYEPAHVATVSALMMGFTWGTAGFLLPVFGTLADRTSATTAMAVGACMLLPAVLLTVGLREPGR